MLAWLKQRLAALRTSIWWRDALSRAAHQGWQGALPALAMATTLVDVDWALLLGYVLGGVVWSLIASIAALPDPHSRSPLVAIAWRLVRSLLAALAGLFAAVAVSDGVFNALTFDWAGAWQLLAGTVLLAAVKNMIATSLESLPEQRLRRSP